MELQINNPFSRIRAEQMGDSAWKYFVKDPSLHISNRPLIFEGSRGSGKTMFFVCNSWRERYSEAKASGMSLNDYINEFKHQGFYYKADGRFVKSFTGKKIDDSIWTGIFNTYFNVAVSLEILDFCCLLIKEKLIDNLFFKNQLKHICLSLSIPLVATVDELKDSLFEVIIKIEHFSNNTELDKPIGLNAGTIIQKLLISLKQLELFKLTTFHIYVDEFEVLNINQQIELNTLLKQSNNDVVYDFGVIIEGIQTFRTASGQQIQPKDDFSYLSMDRFEYQEASEYNKLLTEICKKRLSEELAKHSITDFDRLTDINYYLQSYPKNYEETLFDKSPYISEIKSNIQLEIKRHARLLAYSEDDEELIALKLTSAKPIQMRMHLALLMRKDKNMVPAKELVEHFITNSKKYKDWYHNMESAIIYLLCHELKIEKRYHGLKVFSALSSGVIRSFLELAEYAFDYAINNTSRPFSFSNPRPFDIEEQTRAVYFVSKFKVAEIESYEPDGLRLKVFTLALGKIFQAIQTNSNSTLGEVEFNHFTTRLSDIKRDREDVALLLKHAVMHKILEPATPTKTKSDDIVELMDYHLNHIYCPAFKISHLRKRKLPIGTFDLAKLLCGSHKEIEEVVSKLSGISVDDTPNLFS